MNIEINVNWLSEMAFETEVTGHRLIMDAEPAVGGKNKGPRPKPLTLASLGGCTGMDVISILKKMRVFPDAFHISIKAEQTDEHPKVYENIHLTYHFKGKDLPADKLQKAVSLSQERYCGVSAMLGKAVDLSYSIEVE